MGAIARSRASRPAFSFLAYPPNGGRTGVPAIEVSRLLALTPSVQQQIKPVRITYDMSLCGLPSAEDSQRSGCPKPLFFGRLLRVLVGLGFFVSVPDITDTEYGWIGIAGLLFAGATFLVAGIQANPGCEITALPNLLLPGDRQLTCWCPIFSPFDRMERILRGRDSTQPRADSR